MGRGSIDADVREHIIANSIYLDETASDAEVAAELWGNKTIWEKKRAQRRWWTEYDRVVKIAGRYIMYPWAVAGGLTARERGWEQDYSSIRFATLKLKTVIYYE